MLQLPIITTANPPLSVKYGNKLPDPIVSAFYSTFCSLLARGHTDSLATGNGFLAEQKRLENYKKINNIQITQSHILRDRPQVLYIFGKLVNRAIR